MEKLAYTFAIILVPQAIHTTPSQLPYKKAVELADIEIVHQMPWAKGEKNAHSIFYNYKDALLKRLGVQASSRLVILENYDPSTGLISGTVWTNSDSLSYIVDGKKLKYQDSFTSSYFTKRMVGDWKGPDCPNLKSKGKYVNLQKLILQKYSLSGEYKVCIVSL